MADPMTSIAGRFQQSIVDRLDAVAAEMAKIAPVSVKRSDVLRAAVEAGLPALEARYGLREKGGRPARKPR